MASPTQQPNRSESQADVRTTNEVVERHVHSHDLDQHTHEHGGGAHSAAHIHADVGEAQPPTQPSRAVMLDVGEHAGALILSSSASRDGLEVEIHPAGEPARRTHVWVLPREGRDGATIYAAVFPSLEPGTYAV